MPLYKDFWGATFESVEELAEYRIRVKSPLLDGAVCPAIEYTFAVSSNAGDSWRNPEPDDKEALRQAVIKQDGCCCNLYDVCTVRSQTQHKA